MSTAANNITLNTGSGGPVVATDFVNPASGISAHVQYVKIDIGGENSHDPVTQSNVLPVGIYALPVGWSSLPVGGGTGGEGITITGSIDAGAVSLTGASFSDLLTAVRGITLANVVAGVTIGVASIADTSVNIAATAGEIGLRGLGGTATIGLSGGTVDQVTLVVASPSTGITFVKSGITIGVATLTNETVSITLGSGGGQFPVSTSISTEAVTSITSGFKFCSNTGDAGLLQIPQGGNSSGASGVTFPNFKAKKYIEFFNLPGGTIGVPNTGEGSSLTGGLYQFSGTRGAFANTGFAALSGAIAVIGTTGASCAAPGGITLGYLAASAGFQLLLPGERLKVPAQDLEDFVAQCITGPDGATTCCIQFTAY